MTANSKDRFDITFWGTRGTLATPGAQCDKAGGNTVCVEITCGETTLICDAGTGIRELGARLLEKPKGNHLCLCLSHAHYDHVEGIPFFAPFFSPEFKIDIWCGKLDGAKDGPRQIIDGFMKRPFFPVGREVFQADIGYHQVSDKGFIFGKDVKVDTMQLNHPGGATAYRFTYKNKSFAYVTDLEHEPGVPQEDVIAFLKDVDMFVYDASLTDDEMLEFRGYGHSSWQEGMRVAKAANAKKYFAFHHMPYRCDLELDDIDRKIATEMPGSGVAREKTTISII